MTQKILKITKDHYDRSGKDYTSPDNCPATIAIREQFGIDATLLFKEVTTIKSCDKIGDSQQMWTAPDFDRLTRGIEFETLITLY